MSDNDDKKHDPEKTVFIPSGGAGAQAPGPSSSEDASAEDAWFAGGDEEDATPASTAPEPPHAPPPGSWDDTPAPPPLPPAPPPSPPQSWEAPPLPDPAPYYKAPEAAPPAEEGRIAVGMTLNHIFEVRRFIARGGMGEVYEGVNVNTDERVAIKVMLSHLALDPSVQAMFRKEARTLTRLSHPALVQYRVLAQEPTLKVFYIVTEYIDGTSLGDVIGVAQPNADQLIGLTRRLAAGLRAAHELGAIHRDIAPDNVLLPEGRLDQAKIIDFGIAKDLDPSNKTIVGDGFAGKLGFVAPEQFGDFDRQIGPWTDIYSLALVILAVALGRPVDMGATLVDAIDKRRAGPDLSAVPDKLRPALAGMLKANPADRFRSMDEVLAALDAADAGALAAPLPPASPPPKSPSSPTSRSAKPPLALIAGGAGAAVIVVGLILFMVLRGGGHPAATPPAGGAVATAGGAGSEKVRLAIEAALPKVACTWIDIDSVNDGPDGVSVRLTGVAGSPVDAQQAINAAARATGAKVNLDASNVFPIGPKTCAPLDTFRSMREPSSEFGRRFTTQQSTWELMAKNDPCVGPNAKAVVDMNIGNASQDFSILGMDGKGGLQQIFNDRAAFLAFKKDYPDFISDKGDDKFTSTSCYNETGLVGELLVIGHGPFKLDLPNALTSKDGKPVDAAWLANFTNLAKTGGWKTSMVWYRVVNDQPT